MSDATEAAGGQRDDAATGADAAGEQKGGVDFYWRPGCGFCMMLDRRLAKMGVPTVKHNIWDDPSAAQFVRDHARGNETVPTVAVGTTVLVNPSADDVLAAMSTETPELLEGIDVPEPGEGDVLRRLFGG